jgi:O-antigen ligase
MYHSFFWIFAAVLPGLGIACGLSFGTAVLMGWAHNWGFLLLLATFVPLRHHYKEISRTDISLTVGLVGVSLVTILSWSDFASPWIFSAYTLLAIWTGWLAYLFAHTVEVDERAWNRGGRILGIGLIPVLFLPAWVWMMEDTRPALEWVYHMTGFSNIRALGHFIPLGAGALIAWLWTRDLPYKRIWWPLIALFWMVCFWSGSRTGLLAGIVGIVGTAVICRISWQDVVKAFLAIIVGAGLSLFLPKPSPHFGTLDRIAVIQDLLQDIQEPQAQTQPQGDTDFLLKASSGRTDLWKRGITSIQEHPILGNGLANWRGDVNNDPQKPMFHLHNIFLDTLHSFGILFGGLFCLILIAGASSALYQGYLIGRTAALPVILLLNVGVMSMFDAVLWMPYPAAIAGISIGMLLKGIKNQRLFIPE